MCTFMGRKTCRRHTREEPQPVPHFRTETGHINNRNRRSVGKFRSVRADISVHKEAQYQFRDTADGEGLRGV